MGGGAGKSWRRFVRRGLAQFRTVAASGCQDGSPVARADLSHADCCPIRWTTHALITGDSAREGAGKLHLRGETGVAGFRGFVVACVEGAIGILDVYRQVLIRRFPPTALSQPVPSELLEAFHAGEGVDVVRESVRLVMLDLIEAEATEIVGDGRYERNDSRVSAGLEHGAIPHLHRNDRRSRHGGDHRHQWPAGAARSRRCTLMCSRSVGPAAYHSTRQCQRKPKVDPLASNDPL